MPAILALLLTAFSATAALGTEQTTRLELEPTTFVTHADDTVAAELGRLTVPLRHRDPGGPTIEIAFVRFPSTSAESGHPIVYLAGGPGGSGIDLARGPRFALIQSLRGYGDVIALDQRGAGLSAPNLTCPDPVRFVPRPALTRETVLRAFETAGRRCSAFWRGESVDLAAFNTEENADDLEALRVALNATKLRLVGMSYGSHLGLAAIRRHADRIDRAILAGVEGSDHTLKSPAALERQLQEVTRLIAADPVAGSRLPDFRTALAAILERLKRQPVVETVTIDASGDAVETTVEIGPYEVQALAAEMLSRSRSIEQIPMVFLPMLAGDFTTAARVMGGARLGASLSAMGVAMDCASGASQVRRDANERESAATLLGDVLDFPFPAHCRAWDLQPLPTAFRSPVRSSVPVLFISGTLDPRTPPANAAELLSGFSRGGHLVVENVGHEDDLLVGSADILAEIGTFMDGGAPRSARVVLPPPRFALPDAPHPYPSAIVIRNVTMIDGTGSAPVPGTTVVIQGGTITSVGTAVPPDVPGARIVDGRGRWLIPGLWDMHVHLSKIGPSALPLFIASGVTGVRDMGGDFAEVSGWRREIAAGSLVGPRVFTPGPMLEAPENVARMLNEGVVEPVRRTRVPVADAGRAALIVDSLATLGVDFIKLRTQVSPELYRALGVEARRHGLKLAGHAVGISETDLRVALPGSIEHYLYPTLEELTSDHRIELFRELAQAGTAMVPTMVVAFNSVLAPDETVTAVVSDTGAKVDSRRAYVSGRLLEDWREQAMERTPAGPAQLQALFPALSRNMFEMRQAGMTVLPGTDAAVVMIYPGFTYHDELQLMHDTLEMTPMEVLVSATSASAAFLGQGELLGTITVGKQADLVLLDENPLQSIGATRRIAAVVARGRLYDRAALDDMLEDVARAAPRDRLPRGD